MYSDLIAKEIVFPVKDKDGSLKGFVSGSFHAPGLMRRFLLRRPWKFLALAFIILASPSLLVGIAELGVAPPKSLVKGSGSVFCGLPEVDLLSIAVAYSARHQAIGSSLVEAFEAYFRSFRIRRYKVIAGYMLAGANRFYQKLNFVWAKNHV